MSQYQKVLKKRGIDVLSLGDLDQIAQMQGTSVTEQNTKLNNEKLYKLGRENGLFTFNELRQRLLH